MTLLVSILNHNFAILVADRRLTSGSKIVDDYYSKLTVLCCHDARVAIAFTGLATANDYDTSEWLMEYLRREGEGDDRFLGLMQGIGQQLEGELHRRKLSQYALTFLVTGFFYRDKGRQPICLKITNVSDSGQVDSSFRMQILSETFESVIVEFEGMVGAVDSQTKANLQKIASTHIDCKHALRKAVLLLQKSATHIKAMKTIGQHCNSAVINAEVDTTIVSTYHVPNAEHEFFGTNSVITKGVYSYAPMMRGAELLAGKELRKRDPCWCGSRLRFKDCHMKKFGGAYAKVPGFPRPMTFLTSCELPEARPSGKLFWIGGGFE